MFLASELRFPRVIILWEIMTPSQQISKPKVKEKFCEEQKLEQETGIDKFAANESLYML